MKSQVSLKKTCISLKIIFYLNKNKNITELDIFLEYPGRPRNPVHGHTLKISSLKTKIRESELGTLVLWISNV